MMSERVICKPTECKVKGVEYKPDPNAPSVKEIVEVMEEASEWEECGEGLPHWITKKIDNLIVRLENT